MLGVDVAMKSAHRPGRGRGRPTRRQVFARQAHALVGAIQEGGATAVEPAARHVRRSLGIVIGVMMRTYVTLPARIVGVRPSGSRRDKVAAAAIGGALGGLVCMPPYVVGRIGILLLGSHSFFALGVVLLVIGLTLQAGATG